ncbi:MAG: ABC transporter permease [Deltaproteobacteria bacterium]|jgi:spermidine/putrescine transport system permease protein|nr:ABC transporter permease [Deltaproteobacteria bacterium]
MRKSHLLFTLTAYLSLALLYVPSLAVVIFSFNNSRYGLSWRGFTFAWYERLIENKYILDAAVNSLVVAFVSTAVATVLGTSLALGLHRVRFSHTLNWLFKLFINLPIVVPDIIMAVALTMAFSFFRSFSSLFDMGFFTLILSHVTFQISFVALIVRSRLATMDEEMELAASDLFATSLYRFRHFTLPLLSPSIIAGAMLAFTLSLDDFIISFFTHGPDSVTLPIFIYASLKRGITPEIHALSTVMLTSTVILVVALERLSRYVVRKSEAKVAREKERILEEAEKA